MRKDNEISSLKTSVARLRAELAHAQKTIFQIKDTETSLKDRLEKERQRAQTLEKMASSNANKQSPSSGYTSLDQRPAGLVRRYGELYSQTRLETLDCLDRLPQLVNAEELKNKLLFSVMVVRISTRYSNIFIIWVLYYVSLCKV
jgi:phage shock protein A